MKTSYQAQNDYYNAASLMDICIGITNASQNTQQLNSYRVFHRRDSLLSAGDHFEGNYILHSSSAKSFITYKEGKEHITKFYYSGDMLGVNGFDGHNQTVCFLETSSVLIRESQINNLINISTVFRDGLLQSMSHTLGCDSGMMMCLSTCSSKQKVTKFLLGLSIGFAERGLLDSKFMLSVTRTNIANYLGMAIETLSRIFAIDICSQTISSRTHSKKIKQAMN
ncbi:MAG: CRP/FNR family transcriptional regulator [Paraglaciecola sp.]|jgi:CRP/FNR family transcriptional regulator